MRCPRIKVEHGEDGLYHCMSRIVSGDYIFERREKEIFIQKMWRLADFLGIEVLDYVVMGNHYHQLLRVPAKSEIGDAELSRRVSTYYGENSRQAQILTEALTIGGKTAKRIREKYFQRMGDLSEYQKLLKQGFTSWYNREKKRKGTLWMERFKSLLIEDTQHVRQLVASYIDLNPVRADIVDDPKNYQYCGYSAALGGDERCIQGIQYITACDDWEEAAAQYRLRLITSGSRKTAGKRGKISREVLLKTLEEEGRLPLPDLLHLRVRYLSDGLVFGSKAFVEDLFLKHRSKFGQKRRSGSRPFRGHPDGGLSVIRDLKSAVFG